MNNYQVSELNYKACHQKRRKTDRGHIHIQCHTLNHNWATRMSPLHQPNPPPSSDFISTDTLLLTGLIIVEDKASRSAPKLCSVIQTTQAPCRTPGQDLQTTQWGWAVYTVYSIYVQCQSIYFQVRYNIWQYYLYLYMAMLCWTFLPHRHSVCLSPVSVQLCLTHQQVVLKDAALLLFFKQSVY